MDAVLLDDSDVPLLDRLLHVSAEVVRTFSIFARSSASSAKACDCTGAAAVLYFENEVNLQKYNAGERAKK